MKEITILHFNDVYNISNAAQVARFATVLADPSRVTGTPSEAAHQLRLFSGDVFSPSLEASVLRGGHMPLLLNELKIDVACYGNHDFDFGEERLTELSRQTNFPWILANAVRKPRTEDESDPELLAEAHEYVVKTLAGFRIGFFGLAGTDWPSNCQHLPDCDILDPVAVATSTARKLRRLGCDLVIALTHLRLPEDMAVSQATMSGDGAVDLLLGGHDHDVVCRTTADHGSHMSPPGVRIVKSGSDWRGLSVLRLKMERRDDGSACATDIQLSQIEDLTQLPGYHGIPPSPRVMAVIADVQTGIEALVHRPLVRTAVPLDGRTGIVRSQESNLGNMLADAMRRFFDTDMALVNSGSIRCDRVLTHVLTVRDVVDIWPFDNALVVRCVPGSLLAEAFENSLSDAHVDGRFLQLSGVGIAADWARGQGQRIAAVVWDGGQDGGLARAVHPGKLYTVAMTEFIAKGFDGYACFRDTEAPVDAVGGMTDTKLLLSVFGAAGDVGCSEAVLRARRAVITPCHDGGLPIVSPSVEGRIRFVNGDL